jgi:hypothetical protein
MNKGCSTLLEASLYITCQSRVVDMIQYNGVVNL